MLVREAGVDAKPADWAIDQAGFPKPVLAPLPSCGGRPKGPSLVRAPLNRITRLEQLMHRLHEGSVPASALHQARVHILD